MHLTQEMARAVRPNGKILLLEHGRSTWAMINRVLDSNADAHACKWGCHWNRDMSALVRDAGLEIDSISRWHFGTTYLIVAKPRALKSDD